MRLKRILIVLIIGVSQLILGSHASVAAGSPVDPGVPSLYWTFDSPTNFQREGVHGTDLTIHGYPTYSPDGVFGGMLNFESSTADYLTSESGLVDLPVGDSPYTISAWVKSRECDRGGILWWGPKAGWAEVTALRVDNCGFVDYWFRADNSVTVTGSFRDTWHFVSSVYDGSSKKMYVDGSPLSAVSSGIPHGTPNIYFRIGETFPDSENERFTGSLDEVSIFGKALSQEEISFLMSNGISTHPISGSPTIAIDPEIELQKSINNCRRSLLSAVYAEENLTIDQFRCASFNGVNEISITGINADITKLKNNQKDDLTEVSTVVQRHVTVDRIARHELVYVGELIDIDLIASKSTNKTMVICKIRGRTSNEIDTFEEIKGIVKSVEQKYSNRKIRLDELQARMKSRRNF